jgi:hypothetical protein
LVVAILAIAVIAIAARVETNDAFNPRRLDNAHASAIMKVKDIANTACDR